MVEYELREPLAESCRECVYHVRLTEPERDICVSVLYWCCMEERRLNRDGRRSAEASAENINP
jgi:hypothetical protein